MGTDPIRKVFLPGILKHGSSISETPLEVVRREAFNEMVQAGWLPEIGQWRLVAKELSVPTEKGPDWPNKGSTLFVPCWFKAARHVYGLPETQALPAALSTPSVRESFSRLQTWVLERSQIREEQVAVVIEAVLAGYVDPITAQAFDHFLSERT